jgi:LacI family transcriptional regulator
MVSYVLNGTATVTVPAETRQRIVDAINTLGYVPNRAARSLRTNKTFTIASIIPDIANPFYPTFVRGVQDIADQQGYDLLMYNTDGRVDKERKFLRLIEQGRVDGVVGVFFHTSVRELAQIIHHNVAVVRLEAVKKRTGDLPVDNVYVDNTAAAQAAVTYLLGQGYRRIAMLTNAVGPGHPRVEGYRQALTAHGLLFDETYIQRCDFTEQGGFAGMQQLLRLAQRPDGVFAANDLMAMGALQALQAANLRVPDEMALMGFDDIPTGRLLTPPLTTVTQFQDQLGRRAAELLFERINQTYTGPGRCEELPFAIITRASA